MGIAAGAPESELETPDAPKPRSARRAEAKAQKEAEKLAEGTSFPVERREVEHQLEDIREAIMRAADKLERLQVIGKQEERCDSRL